MAESWNKKEREKKKQQKKKQKEERKQDRKNNPDTYSEFSYVDEFGNVTSTPPDPDFKKTEINVDDIAIGATKREPDEPVDLIHKGVVTHFNDSKGYGFIRDDATKETVFVHTNGLTERIQENNRVEFEIVKGHKGLNAVNVRLAPKK